MKVIAFYLPQFHQIPENDEWWGEGFTEWDNVRASTPLFEGHAQPRIPADNNYYDLAHLDVMRWQVDLAKQHGLGGFCFYHYWFDGHMLLEKPVEAYLANTDLDLPFCICWANEHWTNAWVSDQNKVLIEQRYGGKKEWKEHFDYLLSYFRDSRYIFVDGKPLIVLYRPEIVDNLNEMLDYWQELARASGFEGLSIAYQHPSFYVFPGKDESRFDYNIEFQPTYAVTLKNSQRHKLLRRIKRTVSHLLETRFKRDIRYASPSRGLTHYDYDEVWEFILNMKPTRPKSIPGAFVDWDNTSRRGRRGIVYDGVTVEKFANYFEQQVVRARTVYKSDYLFIFAWNEWAEGGYLEPDELRGLGFLQAIRRALENTGELPEGDF